MIKSACKPSEFQTGQADLFQTLSICKVLKSRKSFGKSSLNFLHTLNMIRINHIKGIYKIPSDSDTPKKFSVLYTNADLLRNNINELKLVVSSLQYKPSLIAITEVKHKKWQTSLSELALSGYDLYSNDLDSSSRGIIVYVC